MRPEEGDVPGGCLVPVAVAALETIMFVFPLTIPFPLLDPDEGLHASIAQEMVGTRDTRNSSASRFSTSPFSSSGCKPDRCGWLARAGWAMRVPGLMFGLLGVIATGLLGGRMFGSTAGRVAGILYATTILNTATDAGQGKEAVISSVTLAILLLWEAEPLGLGTHQGIARLRRGRNSLHGGSLFVTLPRKLRSRRTTSNEPPLQ